MERKHKHLDLIQGVVNRMAQHSFVLKGWSVTLVVAVFALSAKEGLETDYVLAGMLPVVVFWILDGYYLQRERLFRALYDEVRVKADDEIDYSMSIKHLPKDHVLFSRMLLGLYVPLLALIVATYVIG